MIKPIKIIKQKSGESLLIVLACMMFLVTLATITLTSSLGVASTTQHQKNKAQIDLLAQSVQMSLQGMLNATTVTSTVDKNLQTEIIISAFNNLANPTTSPLFDKLTISVQETITAADGTETIIDHSYDCLLDMQQLQISGNNISGVIWVNVIVDLDPQDTSLAGQAEYRMGFSLDNAVYDTAAENVTSYGEWTLVEYEKVEN